MAVVRLARMAMASRFELVLEGEDEVWLRAAGEEALAEIQRLDAQLSIYRAESELSQINARAAHEDVQVEPRLFSLLQKARAMHDLSEGAFDVTVAPLMRAWGFFRGEGSMPSASELDAARRVTGMHLVHLDPARRTVRFERSGVMIDLGGIGKGYAVDEAIGLLREAGVERAFLHGGTSTSYGLGQPQDQDGWRVSIDALIDPTASRDGETRTVAVAALADASLSVSAVWGKAFEHDGVVYGHVLDPRLGRPVEGAMLTAVVSPSATEADALSTALLVQGRGSSRLLRAIQDECRALLLFPSSERGFHEVIEAGLSCLPSTPCRQVSPG